MTGLRLNAMEKRRIEAFGKVRRRQRWADLLLGFVLALGLVAEGVGVYRLVTGIDAWQAALSTGDLGASAPGAPLLVGGAILSLLALFLRAYIRDQVLVGALIQKLLEAADGPTDSQREQADRGREARQATPSSPFEAKSPG